MGKNDHEASRTTAHVEATKGDTHVEATKTETHVTTDAEHEADAPVPTQLPAEEQAIIDWGNENGRPNQTVEQLRDFAPHELLAAYDEAQAAPADEPVETEEDLDD